MDSSVSFPVTIPARDSWHNPTSFPFPKLEVFDRICNLPCPGPACHSSRNQLPYFFTPPSPFRQLKKKYPTLPTLLTPTSLMTRSNDAVLKLFNDHERSATTIKLKNPPARKASKHQPSWKERATQLENQGFYTTPLSAVNYIYHVICIYMQLTTLRRGLPSIIHQIPRSGRNPTR